MSGWRRQARRECVELVVQALLEHLAHPDQRSAVANGRQQRVDRLVVRTAAKALAREADERRAVALVGLEASRAELGAGGLCLRRREQAQRAVEATLELCGPRAVERAGRLQRDHRRPFAAGARDQALELSDPVAQRRETHWLADHTSLAACKQSAVGNLAAVDGDDQRLRGDLFANQLVHEQPSPLEEKKEPSPTEEGSLKTVAQELSADPPRDVPNNVR